MIGNFGRRFVSLWSTMGALLNTEMENYVSGFSRDDSVICRLCTSTHRDKGGNRKATERGGGYPVFGVFFYLS